MPPPRSAAAPPVRATVPALAAVYLIWGSTYLAMRYALEGFPPLLMAGVRFIAAGGAMLGWAALRGDPLPDRRQWLAALPVGPLLFVVGNGFIALAEQSVGSGVAAVVVATMPLWMGLLSAAAGERPGRREWLGVGLGFGAVAFLASGDDLRGEPGATLFLLCSPLGWALGSAVARRAPRRPGGLIAVAGVQMLAGGAAAIAVGLAIGERMTALPGAVPILAVAYLVVFGSLVGFTAYSWLLAHTRPVLATSYAFVNPIIAVALGTVVAAEPLRWHTAIAAPMVATAVALAVTARAGSSRS
ncbi:MAG TPA: drug/metabolite exporter YedA [Kofleriaceae bacterium]|nr:drug/metabolite exporter YedA [Kofleriaceae bacterium]